MKLKYNKKISGGKVFITLDIAVSGTEFKAIRMIGEPEIAFSKRYPLSGTDVKIKVPLMKLKNYEVVFKAGNVSEIYQVAEEALAFIEHFKDYLEEIVEDFVVEYHKLLRLQETNNDTETNYSIFENECISSNNKTVENPSDSDEQDMTALGDMLSSPLGIKLTEELPQHTNENRLYGIMADEVD